jgi:hypothetical protein
VKAKLKPFDAVRHYCLTKRYPEPTAEVRFHESRRWRFDCSWPARVVAVEFMGGVYSGGRHVRGKGYSDDCEKLATAAAMGWRVLPVTTEQLNRGDLWPLLDTIFAETI